MTTSTIYLIIAVLSFLLVVIVLGIKRKRPRELSGLELAATIFVISGIVVESRLFGYSLIGAGIILTVINYLINRRKAER